MSRYFFDVQLDHGLFPDKEGTELADISAAEAEANAILAELPRVRAGEACSATVTGRDESFHSVLEGRLTVEVTKL